MPILFIGKSIISPLHCIPFLLYSCPAVSEGSASVDSNNLKSKIFEKEKKEYRKLQKAKLEFA